MNTATTTIPENRKRSVAFEYTVVEGDTLFSIGDRYKISTDALKYVNNLTDYSILKLGQKIVIPPVSVLEFLQGSNHYRFSVAVKVGYP